MTEYFLYEEDAEGSLRFIMGVQASGAVAALRQLGDEAKEGMDYAAIPTRHITVRKPKKKPATVSWS